jgi:G3E family GTPase
MTERLPFWVVTGGLGSGKTTLLARLLRHPAMARTGVLVNEFGEIAIDADLLGEAARISVVLAGGCVCCAAPGELVAALRTLATQAGAEPLARVVIETSGLADPLPVLQTLATIPALSTAFLPAGVIATVDAVDGERELDEGPVALRQVALADRIVLTKTDIAAPPAVARLQARLRQFNPAAVVIVASHGEVAPERLFAPAAERRGSPRVADDAQSHAAGLQAVALTWDAPVHWEAFAPALERLVQGHPIRRLKGLLHVAGVPAPVVVQAVRGRLYPPVTLDGWPDDAPASRLVAIGRGLDAAALRAALPVATNGAHGRASAREGAR